MNAKAQCGQKKLRLLNEEQERAWDTLERNEITFLVGAPGSGKTQMAIAYAWKLLTEEKVEKIILTRPIVEAGEKLGHLPGTYHEKTEPYMMPLFDCLSVVTGRHSTRPDEMRQKLGIEVVPLAYCRGRTFSGCACILDEAQNASLDQIKMFLTRMGKGSKMLITGDPDQSDLRLNALGDVALKLRDVPGIGVFQLRCSAIVRHPLVAEVVKRL